MKIGNKIQLPLLGLILASTCLGGRAAESVVIDSSRTYQTIRSWGAPSGLSGNPDTLLPVLLDELVHTMGLTRLRFEPARREWEDALNDDADPQHVNTAAFITRSTDDRVKRVFLPFKQRVEASGEHFELYVSPSFFDGGSSGTAPAWLLNSPGEYAEWACAFLTYLRSQYRLEPDFYSICNEAGNNNAFTASVVANLGKTLGPRLEGLGFRTRLEFPECVSADTSWNYLQSTQNDAELRRYVGLVSYHLYGGNNSRTNIRDFALARQLPTAQTEYMGLNLNFLYDDLTLGGVSTWEFYALNDLLPLNSSRSWFSRTQTYWQSRQVIHFVRPGAVRVAANTSTNALRALAFLKNDKTTLVLINTTDSTARAAEVTGLTAGVYGRSQTVGSGAAQELGSITVSGSGPVSVSLVGNSTLTLYPYPDTNLPPVLTDWKATPSYLSRPASTATLSAAATDPENNPLTYAWSLLSAPPGAAVYLGSPNSASCSATGLVATGSYFYQVVVTDGPNTVTRRLPLQVFNGNQPPELFDVHHRLPTTVILPVTATTLRCAGRDLEGDPLTYQWAVVTQPAGAAATLLSPTVNACVATNLTLPGDYVFSISLRDPSHLVTTQLWVTVYPSNHPPVIASATASPASLTLPASSALLSASTSDADGDAVSHWWSLVSAPSNALPVFGNPGSTVTSVSGLILPGTYTFKLTVVDRSGVTTRNVSLTAAAGSNPPLLFLACPNGGETYTAGQSVNIRWSSFQLTGNVKLEWYDGSSWTALLDSTPNDGIESWTIPHRNLTGCRLRVSAAGAGTLADESDGTFSITAATPRFGGIYLTNRAPVLEFELEPNLPNTLQRTTSLSPGSGWETLLVLSNSAQSAVWTDTAATNLPAAFYRITAP